MISAIDNSIKKLNVIINKIDKVSYQFVFNNQIVV
jgi:hypothetical protein